MSSPAHASEPETAVRDVEFHGLDRDGKIVFAGLMLGMFVASISQSIVGPAMPRIVAELGGLDYYNWVITATMLVSAMVVPIIGKLSDMYGRKGFYLAGLVIFMGGTAFAGMSLNFWMLVGTRAIQGLGMGILMPLSQIIIGDIVPARQRGKYQGLMGTTFAASSVAGPLIGGSVTDTFGWRYLFYLALPLGIAAFFFILRYMRLDFTARHAKVDVAGICTLIPAMLLGLLATTWAGSEFSWTSPVILGMFAVSIAFLIAFVLIERKATEPLVPLGMLRNPVVALSIVSSFCISVAMFGAVIYIPVYAQGVMGASATVSGMIMMPHVLIMMGTGIVTGFIVAKVGRYKPFLIVGTLVLLVGNIVLALVDRDNTPVFLTVAMMVTGLGLGLTVQLFTLVIQNAVPQSELGVATSALQFTRNVGATLGTAVLGTVMSAAMGSAVATHVAELPEDAAQKAKGIDAGSVLDPSVLNSLPEQVAGAVRQGLAEAIGLVFIIVVPIAVAAFLPTLFLKEIPLSETLQKREPRTRTGSMPAIAAEDGSDYEDVHGPEQEPARARPAAGVSSGQGAGTAQARRERS